jgi:hypothetical protein
MNSYGNKGIAFNGIIEDKDSSLLKKPGYIITDMPYSGYIARYLGVACVEISPIENEIKQQSNGNMILLRSYILNHYSLGLITEIKNKYYQGMVPPRPNLKNQIDENQLNEIYDSSYVWAYKA